MKKVLFGIVLFFGLVSIPAISSHFNEGELVPADIMEKQLEVQELSEQTAEGQMDLQSEVRRRRCNRGRCDDGRGRRRPPRRRPPNHRDQYICYAESARGHWYSAWAHRPRVAQRRAMSECYRFHRRCYEAGCRRY